MLIDIPVGETNLERQSAAFIFGSRDPFEGVIVCGKFQTPPVHFVIGVLAVKESC